MTTLRDEEAASPLLLGDLQTRFRDRSTIEFLEEFQCPLLLHESAPESARRADVSFRTLITTADALHVSSRAREVIPVRKVPGRNPFDAMITIGRAANNDMVIPFDRVSKFHAYIALHPVSQRCVLVDAGSANGTFLEGRRLERGAGVVLDLPEAGGLDVAFGDVRFSLFAPLAFWGCAMGRPDLG